MTTVSDLIPQVIYTIRVQAFTARGSAPLSAPVQVKTQQGVPGQVYFTNPLLTSFMRHFFQPTASESESYRNVIDDSAAQLA